jgi:hypothetical protein
VLHELIQAGLVTYQDLVSSDARKATVKGWLTNTTKQDLFDKPMLPALSATFNLEGKFATLLFSYDTATRNYVNGVTMFFDDLLTHYTWDEVDEESKTMNFADVADVHEEFLEAMAKRANITVPFIYMVTIDGAHFVVARPANQNWSRLERKSDSPAPLDVPAAPVDDAAPAAVEGENERMRQAEQRKKNQPEKRKKKKKQKEKEEEKEPERAPARRSARGNASSARLDLALPADA